MISAIREVRRARNMTLDDVARACTPPTTPQTIGRLETGTRTVSVAWLNRIAAALGVTAGDLVTLPTRSDLPLAAIIDADGTHAPRRAATIVPPAAAAGLIALSVASGVGDYRAGDEVWCETLAPGDFGRAMNRDVLVPRGAGQFLFGRLIGRDEAQGGGRLHLLPLTPGSRQHVMADPPWLARAVRLVRLL
ncbi:helix-turn-helix domain-containing protein [Sphingomonas bacterium]|uniref:helix-turn-helix domain-containing protein n=1 Tax=Sphingomonas bacterium TaxID=1895847 RepID=UPI001576E574|nr:helix-turn-helix transcriptional regulator [Sphingomonas bacterium]